MKRKWWQREPVQLTVSIMSYSKLFSSIVHSSLWTEEDHVRLLFVTLLAIADREGYIYGSRKGLERLANIDSGKYERDPWGVLMEPDADSSDLMRNPDNEGRRIEPVSGGFRILNYAFYRSLRNSDDRREQNREAQRRHRGKRDHWGKMSSQRASAKVSNSSAEVSRDQPQSSQADAEAEKSTPIVPLKGDESEEIYEAFPKKVAKPKALAAIRKALTKVPFPDLLAKTRAYAAARKGELQFCAYPATWFNQERYNDDPSTWEPHYDQSARKPKQSAPSYPKLPPRIEQSEEDREKAAAIAKAEAEKFRQRMTT